MHTLTVEKREALGKRAAGLRARGILPAVLYGRHESATSISLPLREFDRVWQEAGESAVVRLSGLGADKDVLIYSVDMDPVRDTPRHVDFYAIEKGQKVQVAVPIEFVGEAPAVRDLGGVLTKVLHELEVEAEPTALPHHITADISSMSELDQPLTIADLPLPPGVVALAEPDDTVAVVSLAAEEPIVEATPIDFSAIEVEKKGKEETQGAEDAREKA
jgi:large subunit ribosomal protein L25